jgi:hypothetical protein
MPNKKILLISPQQWGKMFVAKHHYAVELARDGNEVYYLNPPVYRGKRFVEIEGLDEYPGISVVDHGPSFPFVLRFHLRGLYDFLMKRYASWLVKQLGSSFDIVWCFEPNLYSNLAWFKANKIIYHPVDELTASHQLVPGENADLIISVTYEILSKFQNVKAQKLFVNHGIAREFLSGPNRYSWKKKNPLIVGYSGNLLRRDIDFDTIKKCISQFPEVRFVFWGNYNVKDANLAAAENEEISSFITFLKQAPTVDLRGSVSIQTLVEGYAEVDIFLICYNIERDQSHGTNYHKVMEFLCTGRVTVSNNITTYRDCELLRMCKSRESNCEFPGLLADTIRNCEGFNSEELQRLRKEFAAKNTYRQHVLTIEKVLYPETYSDIPQQIVS